MPISLDSTLYTKTLEKIDVGLVSYISSTSSSVIQSITPGVGVLLSIYVMLWGWSMLRGLISEPIMDGVTRIVKLSVITGIALSAGTYSNYITDWVWNAPESIARVVSGQDSTASVSFLDLLLGKFFSLGNNFMLAAEQDSTLGIPDLSMFISSMGILLAGVILTAYSAFLLILGKMSLAILMAVGPIFIALSIFETTRKFLDAWISQTLNYVFLIMLTAACIKLVLVLVEHYFRATEISEPNIGDALQLIALSMIGFLVLIQMPNIASSLGGGVALTTLNSIGWTYEKMKGASASTRRVITGQALAESRAARKRRADMAKWAARNPIAIPGRPRR